MNAEQQVIGACLLSEDAIRFASDVVMPRDFEDMRLSRVFSIMIGMKSQGEPVEIGTVEAKAKERQVRGVDWEYLFKLLSATNSAATVGFYAGQVKEQSVKRSLRLEAGKLLQAADRDGVQSAKALSESITSLQAVRDDAINDSIRAKKLGEVLAVEDQDNWIIENLLEAGDRLIITGAEGLGKSTWIRQMSITMAAGLNPVTLMPIRPVRTLVVDTENSERQWRREVRGIRHTAAKHGSCDPSDTLDLACTDWIDITKDKDLGMVHRLMDEHEPEVMFIGPLYRLINGSLNDETDAAKLLQALGTFLARGVALVMEGHSAKGGMGERSWSPRGSAALMGWPEFGFGLEPNGDNANVRRWRGDRDRNRDWPKELYRGGAFPWTAPEVPASRRHELLGWKR